MLDFIKSLSPDDLQVLLYFGSFIVSLAARRYLGALEAEKLRQRLDEVIDRGLELAYKNKDPNPTRFAAFYAAHAAKDTVKRLGGDPDQGWLNKRAEAVQARRDRLEHFT